MDYILLYARETSCNNFVYQKTLIHIIYTRILTKVIASATVGISATVVEMSATVGEMSATVGKCYLKVQRHVQTYIVLINGL